MYKSFLTNVKIINQFVQFLEAVRQGELPKGLRVIKWHEINVNLTTKHVKFNVRFCNGEQKRKQYKHLLTKWTPNGEWKGKASLL